MIILGIGNKARHGKDSFASAIENYYRRQNEAARQHNLMHYKPIKVQRISFADEVYKEVNDFLSTKEGERFLDGEEKILAAEGVYLPDWVKPTIPFIEDPRAPYGKHSNLLQWWGTQYRRAQDSDYWIRKWKSRIDPRSDIVLTPDMRFLNEVEAIKKAGGVTVLVKRLNSDGSLYIDSTRDANHPSEVELDNYNFDYQIVVKTGEIALLDEYAITLVHYLRAIKYKK